MKIRLKDIDGLVQAWNKQHPYYTKGQYVPPKAQRDYYDALLALAGQTLDVDTKYLFENSFNAIRDDQGIIDISNAYIEEVIDDEGGDMNKETIAALKTASDLLDGIVKQANIFNSGDRVHVKNLSDFSAGDFGLEEEDYQMLLEHEGEEAVIVNEATSVGDEHFYNITFDDGSQVDAISDYHLSPLE